VLDEIEALGLRDRTLVVLTADHGEGLGEDGYWFAHGHSAGLDQVRVPLGTAYFSSGQYEKAVAVWGVLVDKNPNLPKIHNNLGLAHLEMGHADKAIAHLERAIGLAPENIRAHANLVTAYRLKGMEDAAVVAERKVKALKARRVAEAAPAN